MLINIFVTTGSFPSVLHMLYFDLLKNSLTLFFFSNFVEVLPICDRFEIWKADSCHGLILKLFSKSCKMTIKLLYLIEISLLTVNLR